MLILIEYDMSAENREFRNRLHKFMLFEPNMGKLIKQFYLKSRFYTPNFEMQEGPFLELSGKCEKQQVFDE